VTRPTNIHAGYGYETGGISPHCSSRSCTATGLTDDHPIFTPNPQSFTRTVSNAVDFYSIVVVENGRRSVRSIETALQYYEQRAKDILRSKQNQKASRGLVGKTSEFFGGGESIDDIIRSAESEISSIERARQIIAKRKSNPRQVAKFLADTEKRMHDLERRSSRYTSGVIKGAENVITGTEITISILIAMATGGSALATGALTTFSTSMQEIGKVHLFNLQDRINVRKILFDGGTAYASGMLSGAVKTSFAKCLANALQSKGQRITSKVVMEFLAANTNLTVDLLSKRIQSAFADAPPGSVITGEDLVKFGASTFADYFKEILQVSVKR